MATTTAKPNIQIDDLVRPMTTEEHTATKHNRPKPLKRKPQAEAKVAARESALAKLAALGLSAEEIAAL
jgi:DNA-binding NarL/FixJ family response regulator